MSLEKMEEFRAFLTEEEKAEATVTKYVHDVTEMLRFTEGREITKELMIRYKEYLSEKGYAPESINSKIIAVNRYLDFSGHSGCRLRCMRIQRRPYTPDEKDLGREEYLRLLQAAEKKTRLRMILETICSTGIRVSELKHFTVEAVERGEVRISCKGKIRCIVIPKKLQGKLRKYWKERGIREGIIFRTRSGNPVDRTNIWKEMKGLCAAAGVRAEKVFPHNLRKLFAKSFYRIKRDIAGLADVLGHSSIETTRIYIMEPSRVHRQYIESLKLVI